MTSLWQLLNSVSPIFQINLLKKLARCRCISVMVLALAVFGVRHSQGSAASEISYQQELVAASMHHVAEVSHCPTEGDIYIGQRLLYVTTLDGTLTALDMKDSGKVRWRVPTGRGPLISSTQNAPIAFKGTVGHLIPTLTGGIYVRHQKNTDETTYHRTAVSADLLLSSSSKFLENVVMSGGKETHTYGISIPTGKLSYECSINGCTNTTNNHFEDYIGSHDPENDDVLVLQRHTKTIYAIEPHTGVERWNFSVAHHELGVSLAGPCHNTKNDGGMDDLDIEIKLSIGDGVIAAFQKSNTKVELWRYQFTHPIAAAWRMNQDMELIAMDLFSSETWPIDLPDPTRAEMFVGSYNGQDYIQESSAIGNEVTNLDEYLQFPWRPIAFRSTSFMPNTGETLAIESEENEEIHEQRLVPYGMQNLRSYNWSNGVFLNSSKTIDDLNNAKCHKNSTPPKILAIKYYSDLKMLPKSFTAKTKIFNAILPAIVTAVAAGLLYFTFCKPAKLSQQAVVYKDNTTAEHILDSEETTRVIKARNEGKTNDVIHPVINYSSRFNEDFELMRKLGHGGFGTVFEVKNKLDQYKYAVKRIRLTHNEKSRERVLREVRILAQCEHRNIVRYFHSWIEEPPLGWKNPQEADLESVADEESGEETNTMPLSDSLAEYKSRTFGKYSIGGVNFPPDDCWYKSNENTCFDSQESSEFENLQNNSSNVSNSENVHNGYDCQYDLNDDDNSYIQFVDSSTDRLDIKSTVNYSDASKVVESTRYRRRGEAQARSEEKPHREIVLFIQMQLCRKESLKDWLDENDLEKRADHSAHIFHQIVDGVEYVHSKGLIHRDLKPQNIFFSQNGEVKIGDFGLVTGLPHEYDGLNNGTSEKHTSNHTKEIGTEFYMSPEVRSKKMYNNKVDIYSLGLILFELHVYFATGMERSIMLSDLKKGRIPLEFQDSHRPLCELLNKMLDGNPDARPGAAKLKQLINQVLPLPQSLVRDRTEAEVAESAALRLSSSRTFSSCE